MIFKKLSIFGLVFFLFMGVGALKTNAATDKNCNLKGQLDELTSIKNQDADYFTALKAELKVRKNILKTTVRCGIEEVDAPKAKVQDLNLSDNDIKNLQIQFIAQLEDAVSYYRNQEGKIDTLGLKGTQDFAANLRSWRLHNERPLFDRIANFLMWVKNQDLMQATERRIASIQKTVEALKLVDNSDIQKSFNDAKSNFQKAQEDNARAKESIQAFADPDESLKYIKGSLDDLSAVYQNFFDLSDEVNKILPHSK